MACLEALDFQLSVPWAKALDVSSGGSSTFRALPDTDAFSWRCFRERRRPTCLSAWHYKLFGKTKAIVVVQGSLKDTFCNHLKYGFFHLNKGTPPFARRCSGV